MGFRRARKTITLQFEDDDDDLKGLEVITRSLNLQTYLDLMGMGEVDRSSISEMLTEFTKQLVSWNMQEEDGTPVPATPEAVLNEDHETMLRVASAWLDAMSGVSAPLEQTSPDGEPSPEASIPMEPLSESLAS